MGARRREKEKERESERARKLKSFNTIKERNETKCNAKNKEETVNRIK